MLHVLTPSAFSKQDTGLDQRSRTPTNIYAIQSTRTVQNVESRAKQAVTDVEDDTDELQYAIEHRQKGQPMVSVREGHTVLCDDTYPTASSYSSSLRRSWLTMWTSTTWPT